MASTPEAKVKTAVKKMLDALGIWHFSPMMNGFGRAGIPDIIACFNGTFLAIECKAGTNVPTPLQERELAAIQQAGGITFVARESNLAKLEAMLKKLLLLHMKSTDQL